MPHKMGFFEITPCPLSLVPCPLLPLVRAPGAALEQLLITMTPPVTNNAPPSYSHHKIVKIFAIFVCNTP